MDTLEAHGVGIAHNFGAGVYAKEARIPAGIKLGQHVHPHDHLSILAWGSAIVRCEGVETLHTGPACLTIKAGIAHEVEAVTDVIWYCIHATDDTDPETVDSTILIGGNHG